VSASCTGDRFLQSLWISFPWCNISTSENSCCSICHLDCRMYCFYHEVNIAQSKSFEIWIKIKIKSTKKRSSQRRFTNTALHEGVLRASCLSWRCIEIYKTTFLAWLCICWGFHYHHPAPELLSNSNYPSADLQITSESSSFSPAWLLNHTSPMSLIIFLLFSSPRFSCQEPPGCSRTGSWWSRAALGSSWARRWPCTSSRSCSTGWDSRCSPAASSSHCTQEREREREGGHGRDRTGTLTRIIMLILIIILINSVHESSLPQWLHNTFSHSLLHSNKTCRYIGDLCVLLLEILLYAQPHPLTQAHTIVWAHKSRLSTQQHNCTFESTQSHAHTHTHTRTRTNTRKNTHTQSCQYKL